MKNIVYLVLYYLNKWFVVLEVDIIIVKIFLMRSFLFGVVDIVVKIVNSNIIWNILRREVIGINECYNYLNIKKKCISNKKEWKNLYICNIYKLSVY